MIARIAGWMWILAIVLTPGCAGGSRGSCGARPSDAAPSGLTIVQDGRSDYVIVTAENPSAAETLAAEELAKYLGRMTGAELEVRRGGPVPAAAIIVADEASRAALAGVPSAAASGEGYAIATDAQRIYITGGRGRGVLYGTYGFLHGLGCRFLAPQYDHYRGAAEVVPRQKTLVFRAATPIVSSPELAYRKLYVEEGHSHDEANLRQMIQWMPKVGYNILVVPTDYQGRGRVKWDNWRDALTPEMQKRDLIIEVGGHGYQNFLNAEMEGGRLFGEHPEWFGMDDKGRRAKAHGRVFCTSNPDAVAYVTNNFLQYVKQRPEIQIFDFWPPDGARWCTCEACRKLGEPPERQAIHVSRVQGDVKKVRPDLQLEAIAYASLIEPPKRAKMDPSVLIDFCPIRQNYEFTVDDPRGHDTRNDPSNPNYNRIYFNAVKGWREVFDGPISIYSYYRRYAWDSLPMQLSNHMKQELTFYASIPTQGVSVYSEPADWYTYEMNHYILPALAWDVRRDVDGLVREFTDARYGPAAESARAALATLQDVVHVYCSVPFVSLKDETAIDRAARRVEKAAKDIDAAVAAAEDDALKRNLGRLRLMLEYAMRDLAVQKMRAANASREEIRNRIGADHQFLSGKADEGVFLVKNHRLSLGRAYARYGVGDKSSATRAAE